MSLSWAYEAPRTLSAPEIGRWVALVEERTGIDLERHPGILVRSVNTRLRELERVDADAYYEEVCALPSGLPEWYRLLDCLTVQETTFFRQSEAFHLVHRFLRRRLSQAGERGRSLDLWSVGCATGEEAWSLAMVAREAIAREGSPQACHGVLATDISQGALAQARAGVYGPERARAVPDRLRQLYMQRCGQRGWTIANDLRSSVCFARGNLLSFEEMPPFPMDVIFCQNVLIYFRRARREAALDALAGRLKPGGVLVVGPGEAALWHHPGLQRLRFDQVHAYVRAGEEAPG